MSSRPEIPADVVQAILTESGHRCAVCGVPCPLERAHIVPWHRSRDHSAENLICLCANCHERADREKWGADTLKTYKNRPWVLRQNQDPPIGLVSRVNIIIDKEFSNFDWHNEEILRHALASFLRISPAAIKIVDKTSGSVQLVIELPSEAADQLLQRFSQGDPDLASHLAIFPLKEISEAETSPEFSLDSRVFVFVAMSFRNAEDPALVDYFEAMRRAAARTQLPLDLRRIDSVEGDFEISQSILREIDQAMIVIADFTLSPRNVYFEAGYARGKGKRVIQTARKDTPLEFDTRSWNTIFYRNTKELEGALAQALTSAYKDVVNKSISSSRSTRRIGLSKHRRQPGGR